MSIIHTRIQLKTPSYQMINQSVLENNIYTFLVKGERHDTDTSVESYLIGLSREGEQNYIKRHCSYYEKIGYYYSTM